MTLVWAALVIVEMSWLSFAALLWSTTVLDTTWVCDWLDKVQKLQRLLGIGPTHLSHLTEYFDAIQPKKVGKTAVVCLIKNMPTIWVTDVKKVTSDFCTSSLPFKRVGNLEHYSIIITKLHSHLIKMQKSHLHGTSLGEFHSAILHCSTKWISKCLHTHYHIFMCFM